MVIFTATLSGLLVTVGVETLADITLTRPTHRVAPPVGWTGLLGLSLTVLTRQEGGVALTPVPRLQSRLLGAGGVTLAGVQVAHIVAGVPHVAGVAVTVMTGPGLFTPGVGRTDGCRGLTCVRVLTARHHPVLQLGAQVGVGVRAQADILKY